MQLTPSRLQRLRVFRDVPLADLAEVCRHVKGARFDSNQVVFEEGAPADHALMVLAGRLGVSVGAARGEERSVGDVWPGEVVGEAALFDTGGLRSATVRAYGTCECAVLSPRLFVVARENRAVIALERHLLQSLARRIRATNNGLERLMQEEAVPPRGPAGTVQSAQREEPSPGLGERLARWWRGES